jgi:Outer membrane protein beta-barrel family/CarboxypepD_reg-like domain
MLKYKLIKSLLFAAALFMSVVAVAQNTAILSGKVVNNRNEAVPGASVVVTELNRSVMANIEGVFSIQLEKGKKYTFVVSSTGYTTKSISEVEVGLAGDDVLTVVLEPKVTSGENIVIRSTRRQESTVALLTFQRTSAGMASGLAADFIRRTPDKNTGEVLKRVSGASIQDNKFVVVRGLSDRYNSAMLNSALLPSSEPDKKAFSFDMFPAALIDNIIINKTATPEFTGEFSGGLVQVNTRDIPTKDVLTIGFGLGYNSQSTFKPFTSNARNQYDWLGFDDGTRNIPDSFPATAQLYRALGKNAAGVAKQVSLTQDFRGDVYGEVQSIAAPIKNFSLTYAQNHKLKNGASLGTLLAVNYRNSMLVYNAQKAFYEADGKNVFEYNDVQNRYQTNLGGVMNITWVKGKNKVSFKNLFNQLYEDNYYKRTGYNTNRLNDIQFYSSYLNQRSLFSSQLEGEHQLSKSGIKFKWNGNGGYNWKTQPDLRSALYARTINTSLPFEIDPDDTRRFYSDLKDYSFGAGGQLLVPMNWGLKDKQTLKLGGSNLTRFRDFNSRIFRYNITNLNSFVAANAQKPVGAAFYYDNMGQNGYVLEEFTNNQDKYFGISVLNAAYGMMDNKFGAFRFIWGLRAENFQQLLTSKTQTGERAVRLTEKWDFLPSGNMILNVDDKQNIRVAASRTVARPEFREIAEFAFFDYEMNYGVKGDTALRRSSILNYDVRYEIYPKAGESISLGAFVKDFTDPIEFRLDPSSNADSRRYFYQNALSARTIGLEFEVRKTLEFLAPALKNFSFFGNYTYLQSEVVFNDLSASNKEVKANRPLQGQSPYLVNAGLQYSSNVFNASVLYNRVGERLTLVGNEEFPNVYERPRNQLDIQLAHKVLDGKGEFKINFADILNNSFYFYENLDSKTSFTEGVDRLFNSYKQGATITVGFTYDFNIARKK